MRRCGRRQGTPATDTIALSAFIESSAGELPYYARPTLGGDNTLRGYIRHRFTGDAAWHATAEYRFWVVPRGIALTKQIRIERIGLALFHDVGTVANSLDALPE